MSLNRRRFVGLLLVVLVVVAWVCVPVAQAAKPNIIIIMSDDMGFSDIGCYGSEIKTPVLDGMAANGVRFTQFYNTGRCCPTRGSLLSGLYPHQSGIGHMMSDRKVGGYRGNLSANCVTIAEAVRPAGYSTYMVGKWHVTPVRRGRDGEPDRSNWPLQRGFDRFYGTIHGAGSFYDPNTLTRDNRFISPYADPEYNPKTYYYTDAINDHAARFIREHDASKPFFMYVAHTAAHWPMHALPEDIAKYKGVYDKGYDDIRLARFRRVKELGLIDSAWDLTPKSDDWAAFEPKDWDIRNMEVYAAMVDRMDQGIGTIVEALKERGQFENTLILFLQDNGGCAEGMGRQKGIVYKDKDPDKLKPMTAEALQPDMIPKRTRDGRVMKQGTGVMTGDADTYHGYGRGWANVSNTPFREYKHWVHEGGIATPLVAHWPVGIKRKNVLEHQPAHLIDLMATCVDLSGAEYPKELKGNAIQPMEGVSLAPAFDGKPLGRKDAIYWEHEGNRALREGKWKLVAKGPGGRWELYDMEKDRTEMHDLAEAEPERLKAMIEKWEAWAKRAGAVPWPWRPAYGGGENAEIGSKEKVFRLKRGDRLFQEQCPRVARQALKVTAEIESKGKDGVIVAHGGSAHGYALYVKDGKLEFAVRRGNQLSAATSTAPLPTGVVIVEASLAAKGKILLKVDGKAVGKGKAPGSLTAMPADGIEVGEDMQGLVGRYEQSNAFGGEIGPVTIELVK